jgi:hypothetical protein
MNRLLTDNIWSQIRSATPKSGHKVAALAYVSTGGYCSFGKGDVLVCDATDRAIKSGETSAAVLKKFYDAGAEIYSCENLHAKTIVCGRTVLIGSCNLSDSSANVLRELAILTSNNSIRSQVLAFIHKLANNATRIDKLFLRRIAKIPVSRRRWPGKIRRGHFKLGKRTWIIKTCPLDPAKYKHEEPFVQQAESEIRKKLRRTKADINWVRWTGKSRFRSLAREGDTFIDLSSAGRGGKRISVSAPAPILMRQHRRKWTRFYFETPDKKISWSQFEREVRKVGIRHIRKNSTKELSDRDAALLDVIWEK